MLFSLALFNERNFEIFLSLEEVLIADIPKLTSFVEVRPK